MLFKSALSRLAVQLIDRFGKIVAEIPAEAEIHSLRVPDNLVVGDMPGVTYVWYRCPNGVCVRIPVFNTLAPCVIREDAVAQWETANNRKWTCASACDARYERPTTGGYHVSHVPGHPIRYCCPASCVNCELWNVNGEVVCRERR